MSIEEAREALDAALRFLAVEDLGENNSFQDAEIAATPALQAADAYALAAHVDACVARDCTPGYGAPSHACGEDDWYCDVALKILQRG